MVIGLLHLNFFFYSLVSEEVAKCLCLFEQDIFLVVITLVMNLVSTLMMQINPSSSNVIYYVHVVS